MPALHRLVLALLCSVISLPLNVALLAQTLAFQHIGVAEGLPSSFMYDLVQGPDGYIWMATEDGICKYNGHQFEHIDLGQRNEQEIIDLFMDSHNRLWMLDLASQVSYLENGKLIPFSTFGSSAFYSYIQFFEDSSGGIWFSDRKQVFRYRDGQLDESHLEDYSDLLSEKGVWLGDELPDGRVVIANRTGISLVGADGQVSHYPEAIATSFRVKGLSIFEGDIYFAHQYQMYRFLVEEERYEPVLPAYKNLFKRGILNLFTDSRGVLWISTRSGVLRVSKTKGGEMVAERYLNDIVMGVVKEDMEGNLWLTTQQNGVYLLASDQVTVIKEEGQINQIATVGIDAQGQLITGSFSGNVRIYDTQNQLKEELDLSTFRIYDMARSLQGQFYVVAVDGIYSLLPDGPFNNLTDPFILKCGAFDEQENFWFGGGQIAACLRGKKVDTLLRTRTYAVLPVGEVTYFGTTQGLFRYKDQSCQLVEDPALHIDIRDLQVGTDGRIWLASRNRGLLLTDGQQLLKRLDTQSGLLSDNCHKIAVGEKYVWVATNKGINRLDLEEDKIVAFNTADGLPSNEISDVTIHQGKVVAASNEGVVVFDEELSVYAEPPIVHITGVKIRERDTLVSESYELQYWQNNIKIDFIGIAIRHARDVLYEYQMEGVDQGWIRSSVNIAQYPSLPPGEYRFRIRARTLNSPWSAEQMIQLHIATPFWQQWWFYLLAFLAISLLLGLLIQALINDFKARNAVQEKLKASQLTALRTQMNPHFIFNALNSIQEFIIREDKR
ncbi:MAG: two-component regulator propeller domain-containing protein, partial [Bacteroidota bacterium]